MTDPAFALTAAMRARLLDHAPVLALLGGGHVFDERPRGANPPYVAFVAHETRDWSVQDAKAHEHFVTLEAMTQRRSRADAQALASAIEQALDNAALPLDGHALVNLRLIFWSVARARNSENYAATLRFRAATEPLS
ncbi:MAG TPA: DUF3168 domain-containing protein [Aestuariivirga sp.]|nr:DUF3168 domain-containing protein [Aestuariivirga sp.]